MPRPPVIIANCGGFLGDDPNVARRQIDGGAVDYLVMDYLAEVTMAILKKQHQQDSTTGYATDFLVQLQEVLIDCVARDIKIISNAGGVNCQQCQADIESLAVQLGIADKVRVGIVLGDDIFAELDVLTAHGESLCHMDSGEALHTIRAEVLSANVYIGAAGLVQALALGANIVVAGRVTDTSLVLAALQHEFGWRADDWDRLAAGVVAGHLLECGAQCTGGNFSDWQDVVDFTRLGYPIASVHENGEFTITKHPDSGGLVSRHTVAEQLLYELGAPAYLSPDCTACFDSIQLQSTPAGIHVTAVRGLPPPPTLKVSISFAAGYRAVGRLLVGGLDVRAKAEKVSEIFWTAVGGRAQFSDTCTQYIGLDATVPNPTADAISPPELLVQWAVRDADYDKIKQRFCAEIIPRVLGSVPGITYLADLGRPRPSGVVGFWPALIDRARVPVTVTVGTTTVTVPPATVPTHATAPHAPLAVRPRHRPRLGGGMQKVQLQRLCLARSGDKGDTCNIGVIARSEPIYEWMLGYLTPQFVKQEFGQVCRGAVERFELPNILAVNFLLHESLGGGGALSLLADAQGKTYAQHLLACWVEVEPELLPTLAP